ncbi:hypothetical protein [Aquimarina algiphila]|uniref:hypothetical protein n=1 Tax=Aquimarina algiphila TaxID=2047982 RepID=UPI00232DABCE|nr:hypothetical protein [Aquimarina algiphila]
MKVVYYFLIIVCISIGFVSCEAESVENEVSNLEIVQIDKEDAGAIGDRDGD